MDYSTGEKEFEPTKFDKVNWRWAFRVLIIVFLIALIILAVTVSDLVTYIGFCVFFTLGFLAGQSTWWYAIRRIWREAMSHNGLEED